LLTVKFKAPEVPPPGAGVVTVTFATPAVATSAALIDACRLVAEPKVVLRAVPFHCTTEEEVKFDPITVKVKLAPPATVELGLREPLATEGLGFGGGGGGALPPPPQPVNGTQSAAPNAQTTAQGSEGRKPKASNLRTACLSRDIGWVFTDAPLRGGDCAASCLRRASDKQRQEFRVAP